jgi:hypothetical protein
LVASAFKNTAITLAVNSTAVIAVIAAVTPMASVAVDDVVEVEKFPDAWCVRVDGTVVLAGREVAVF